MNTLLIPAGTGVAGAFTPCALGINTVLVGALAGKPRVRRLGEWALFALVRASFLTGLGLAFGLLGQVVGDMARIYQQAINVGLIALGLLFIVSRFRPMPVPVLSLAGGGNITGARNDSRGVLVLGILFGLDISACVSPLVLALLGQTVLIGNWLAGAAALLVFGVALSGPALVVTLVEGANRWLLDMSRRYRTAFYLIRGGLLILFGAAEFLLTLSM